MQTQSRFILKLFQLSCLQMTWHSHTHAPPLLLLVIQCYNQPGASDGESFEVNDLMGKGGIKDQKMLSKMRIVGENLSFSPENIDII